MSYLKALFFLLISGSYSITFSQVYTDTILGETVKIISIIIYSLSLISWSLLAQEVIINEGIMQSNLSALEPSEAKNSCSEADETESRPISIADYDCECDTAQDSIKNFKLKNRLLWTNSKTIEKLKLKGISFGGEYLNDSNMFMKVEDDLGMTSSFSGHLNLMFSDKNNSMTNFGLEYQPSLHTQLLSIDDDHEKQSVISSSKYIFSVKNNSFLINNKDFSIGTFLKYSRFNTDPDSGFANVQLNLHDNHGFTSYLNQENPYVQDESYITPGISIDYEKIKILKGKCYLKAEAALGLGAMIPLKKETQLYTPIQGSLRTAMTIGYAPKGHPLIYLKVDTGISNEPLPYNRDHGMLGVVGVGIGNEIPLMKKDKLDIILFLETKMLKPYGSREGGPIPAQSGRRDIIHSMAFVKLKFILK